MKLRGDSKLCSRTYVIDVDVSAMTLIYSSALVCAIVRDDARLYHHGCVRDDLKLLIVTNVSFFALGCVHNRLLVWSEKTLNYSTSHACMSVCKDGKLPTFLTSLLLCDFMYTITDGESINYSLPQRVRNDVRVQLALWP